MKKELLAERAKILCELDLVDKLLASRYQWTPDALPPVVEQRPAQPTPPPQTPLAPTRNTPTPVQDEGIQYTKEAAEWLASINHKGPFTVRDFREWLFGKFGEANVNADSMKTPMSKLEKAGKIIVVEQGSGRRPTSYRLL